MQMFVVDGTRKILELDMHLAVQFGGTPVISSWLLKERQTWIWYMLKSTISLSIHDRVISSLPRFTAKDEQHLIDADAFSMMEVHIYFA